MSTQYLLTRIADTSKDLQKLVKKLQSREDSNISFQPGELDSIQEQLKSLSSKVEAQRTEVLKSKGKDPQQYDF